MTAIVGQLRELSAVREERNDETLMVAYQRGDTRAFEVLLQRHQRGVFNFLARQVANQTLAEDLLQEVFLRVIKGARNYKREAKFTTWLYTIARNLCVDNARRAKHRQASSLDQPAGKEEGRSTVGDLIPDKRASVDRVVVNRQLQGRIKEAVSRLSEEQREVFLMRESLNLPFKEIAEIVGCPENTVKSRMRYALENLRNQLQEYRDLAQAVH